MRAKSAVIAALPREIAGLVKGVAPDAALRGRGIFLYRLPDCVAVAAGMGAERAILGVEAALATGDVAELISAGLAGSCESGLPAGSVVEARVVVDTKTGERFECAAEAGEGGGEIVLATTEEIAGVAEKARLARAYGAAAVDMEAATVGRMARAHGLSFRAIKGISDGPDVELSVLSEFTGTNGGFRTGAFAVHTALRPWTWEQVMALGRDSKAAIGKLNAVLKVALARPGDTAA